MRPIKNFANIYVHHTYTSTIIPIKMNIALQLYNQFGKGKKTKCWPKNNKETNTRGTIM